ncbi:ATP-binding protein [Streptomyces sp. NPDC052687]|uniref:ATP-binding protein n=1 Tax=Streptomyces sp. NPDC052687 TaxID=3154759 RepID=UPI003418222F
MSGPSAHSADSAAPVPVPALGDVLLVTLQGELYDSAAEQLPYDVTQRIAHHGGGRHMEMTALNGTPRRGLRLSFTDDGPGVRDAAPASTDGRTTDGGLGLGVSGARRLTQEVSPDSRPGEGTTVTVTVWTCALPSSRAGAT